MTCHAGKALPAEGRYVFLFECGDWCEDSECSCGEEGSAVNTGEKYHIHWDTF